jgi:hypothetical protein
MISNAIGWYFRQRHDELWKLANTAAQNQLDLLEYFTEKLSRTEYGQVYGIQSAVEYKEFVDKIPVVGYEELKSYILRSMDGEQKLIWPGEITWFAKTTANCF